MNAYPLMLLRVEDKIPSQISSELNVACAACMTEINITQRQAVLVIPGRQWARNGWNDRNVRQDDLLGS